MGPPPPRMKLLNHPHRPPLAVDFYFVVVVAAPVAFDTTSLVFVDVSVLIVLVLVVVAVESSSHAASSIVCAVLRPNSATVHWPVKRGEILVHQCAYVCPIRRIVIQ